MANFKEFRTLLQKHFDEMVKDGHLCLSPMPMRISCMTSIWTASRLARILFFVSAVSMIAPAAVAS